MGVYLNKDLPVRGKVKALLALEGFKRLSKVDAKHELENPDVGVVIVINNTHFDAAAYVEYEEDFDSYVNDDTGRKRTFIVGPKDVIEELVGRIDTNKED